MSNPSPEPNGVDPRPLPGSAGARRVDAGAAVVQQPNLERAASSDH